MNFKEFFFKEHIMFGKVVNPNHMKDSALFNHGLNKKARNVAKRYSPDDINRDRNTTQKIGVISPQEAEKNISEYNLSREKLAKGKPCQLGKRPFTISQDIQTKQYSINRL
jgi:hypothetical protein